MNDEVWRCENFDALMRHYYIGRVFTDTPMCSCGHEMILVTRKVESEVEYNQLKKLVDCQARAAGEGKP